MAALEGGDGEKGTRAEGVVIREESKIPAGWWRVEAQEPRNYCHGRGPMTVPMLQRPFTAKTVIAEIIGAGEKTFALAPDLYKALAGEVFEGLAKEKTEGSLHYAESAVELRISDDAPIWEGKVKNIPVRTEKLEPGWWRVNGSLRRDLSMRDLVELIAEGAERISVPERYAPILTFLAESRLDHLPMTHEARRELIAELEGIEKDLSEERVPSSPEDRLYVETTLGDAEDFLGPMPDLRKATLDGSSGNLLQAVAEAVKAHREGWREASPVITRRQPGEPELRDPFDEGLATTDALALWRHLASRLYEVDLEHCLRYGKRGEPTFYRLRVRLRQLGTEDIKTILALAETYQARIGWHVKSAAEPVIELT